MFSDRIGGVIASLVVAMSVCLSAADCTDSKKNQAPEGLLRAYVSQSFGVKKVSDRAVLLTYLTGDSKKRLEAWSEEQFESAFLQKKRKLLKFNVRGSNLVSETEATITYEVVYLDTSSNRNARVTNVKMAMLVREDGSWLISRVKNIKEVIDYQDEMSLP